MLLQAFYTIRSERQLMERLEFDLLFRWFVGLGQTSRPGTTRPFRRTATGCWRRGGRKVPRRAADPARGEAALSSQHFSADGTLIEAWASLKSFKPKPGEAGGAAAARGRGRWRRRQIGLSQRGDRLPRREALERDPSLDHRSRGAALS